MQFSVGEAEHRSVGRQHAGLAKVGMGGAGEWRFMYDLDTVLERLEQFALLPANVVSHGIGEGAGDVAIGWCCVKLQRERANRHVLECEASGFVGFDRLCRPEGGQQLRLFPVHVGCDLRVCGFQKGLGGRRDVGSWIVARAA